MGAFIDSLPPNTAGAGQNPYAAAVLAAVVAKRFDPIPWTYITVGRVKLAVFSKPMAFEGVYLAAGAGLLQQIADVLGCSLLTPKISDQMYVQSSTKILPWLDYDPSRMMTIAWFKRSTAGINALLAKAGYTNGLAMGIGKPWQLDNDLLLHPGRSENYGLYVPANLCPGGRYSGVATEASVSLPANRVRLLQGRGWAHTLGQSDYSELISLVNRNCEVDGQLRDLVDVLRDPDLAQYVSHNGPLKIVRQPGVPFVSYVGGVGGGGSVGGGADGRTAAPFAVSSLPPEDGPEEPPAPLPPPVPMSSLQPSDRTNAIVGGILVVATAVGAGLALRRWRARHATR